MKFTMTKIAALATMAFASTGAHAVLNSGYGSGFTIHNDAVTSYNTTSSSWYISSDGALADSFFTMGGSKAKQALDTQYAYISGTSNVVNLNGSIESTFATFTYYGAPGSFKSTGTGFSILSASGDSAQIDMSGLTMHWFTDIALGTGAWSTGYTDGVGNLTCSTGSGCGNGSDYTLKYTATLPVDAPYSGGVKFYLELHGIAGCTPEGCGPFETSPPAIPEASTYGMMLAGLGLVGAMARRRKHAEI